MAPQQDGSPLSNLTAGRALNKAEGIGKRRHGDARQGIIRLGHFDLKITERYSYIGENQLKQAVQKLQTA